MEMVGIMAAGGLREQAMELFNSTKEQEDMAMKTEFLGRLKEIVLYRDPTLLAEFVPCFLEFHSDIASAVRINVVQIIEEIGLKHPEYTATMVPILISLIRDNTSAVIRSAISAGSNLFRHVFQQVAMQGLYSGHVDKLLKESWVCVNSLKETIYTAAKEQRTYDGIRFLGVKFLETLIFLYTPDPSRCSQAPPEESWDGHGFNISWIVGGHPVLDAEALGHEADGYLTYLLEQLTSYNFPKLSGPVAVVLVNSLASIAKGRPALYGLILPGLTGLGPICEAIRGPQKGSIVHAVKNALVSLLRCTHAGAGLWRERLVSTLRGMNAGDVAEAAVRQTDRIVRNAERERAFWDSRLSKEEKVLHRVDHKRPLQENGSMSSDLNVNSGKRVRMNALEPSLGNPSDRQDGRGAQGASLTLESSGITLDSNLTPLQQMIAMIGALVAKGERAAASIEVLISSLPADMLADVVIENMKNLPPTAPAIPLSANVSGLSAIESSTIVSSKLQVEPASEISSPVQPTSDHRRDPRRDPRRMDPRRVAVPVGVSQSSASVKLEESAADSPRNAPTVPAADSSGILYSSSIRQAVKEEERANVLSVSETTSSPSTSIELTSSGQEVVTAVSDTVMVDAVVTSMETLHTLKPESLVTSGVAAAEPSPAPPLLDVEEHGISVEPTETAEPSPLVSPSSTPLVEPATPRERDSDGAVLLSGATTPGLPAVAPVLYLDEHQQMDLWKVLLLRILESYKTCGPVTGSSLRAGLLARLVAQATEDDEAVRILQKYVLAGYQNNKGHELVMHTLYQLYSESMPEVAEEDTARIASSIYDRFFLAVAQGLRDTLPPTDKSLSKLLSEAPEVPDEAMALLESICVSKEGADSKGDRIFQGLSAVWILILLRPPIRAKCLDIALKCAVHELEEVRAKAIRLVANKLYPLSYVSQRIEEFAIGMLHRVVGREQSQDGTTKVAGGSEASPQKQPPEQVTSADNNSANGNVAEGEHSKAPTKGHVTVHEAHRCMSLYFALCTKKVPLLERFFSLYEYAPKPVRQAAHRNMPVLVRTIGPSDDLLQLLSDPPPGSKNFLLLVLHLLTESGPPSPKLIAVVKQLFESKLKDARLLTPILSSLSKAEVLPYFPHLVALPSEDFKAALDRILQGSVNNEPALTPAEVLIAIHAIDPERDHIPLSMVKDACAVCFQQRTVFTQQVLAKVLKQLVEQTPLPMLFMRTVILAVGSFRPLVNFVMEILSRLIMKQIWKWPNLWIGFLKCADQTQPHSFPVLLQLPAPQLEKALHKHPNLRAPLAAHANKPSIRSTLPRPILVVLGLAQDALPSETALSGQSVPDVASSNTGMERPAATT